MSTRQDSNCYVDMNIKINSLDDIQNISKIYKISEEKFNELCDEQNKYKKYVDSPYIYVVDLTKDDITYDSSNNGEQIVKIKDWELNMVYNCNITFEGAADDGSVSYLVEFHICDEVEAKNDFMNFINIFKLELEKYNLTLVDYEIADIKFDSEEEIIDRANWEEDYKEEYGKYPWQ